MNFRNKFLILTSTICLVLSLSLESAAGRIVTRKVKDPPKVCSIMNEDKFLSRTTKRIYGTLRNSLIFDDKISVINDLGKVICQWNYEEWLDLGDVTQYRFFIDEYKNKIMAFSNSKEISDQNQYKVAKIDLAQCQLQDIEEKEEIKTPKCEKPRKIKNSKKKNKTA